MEVPIMMESNVSNRPIRQRSLSLLTYALVSLSVWAFPSVLSGQGIDWIRQFGTSNPESAAAIATDATGVYVAGSTWGTLPGQTSTGASDAYVRKYDGDGNEIWTHQFGTTGADNVFAVAADATGVYVAGLTSGAFPGQTNAGNYDAYVRKYDGDGNVVWTRQFGTAQMDEVRAIAINATGVYVAGSTYNGGTLAGQTSAGGTDAYIRKYDGDGNEIWTRQFGSSSSDYAQGAAVDATGVYVAGYTFGALPGQASEGLSDAYVRKYDSDGNEVWTRQFGTSDYDAGYAVVTDATGVYVAGDTRGALPDQTSAGGADIFVRKYDRGGNEIWLRQFGTAGLDYHRAATADAAGVYVAGLTYGAFSGQTNAGGSDAFVRQYDSDGNEIWTRQFGTAQPENAFAVAADATGVYVAGDTSGALPDQTSAGGVDGYVAKIAKTPQGAIQTLIAQVQQISLQDGTGTALDAKLQLSLQRLNDSNRKNDVAAVNALRAFINEVEAQRGIHVSDADAAALIHSVEEVINNLE